jgi:hypothetical protein
MHNYFSHPRPFKNPNYRRNLKKPKTAKQILTAEKERSAKRGKLNSSLAVNMTEEEKEEAEKVNQAWVSCERNGWFESTDVVDWESRPPDRSPSFGSTS